MALNKDVNLSYWELKAYFDLCDLIVIGGGIVGLSTAISYKLKHKKARILILERGWLPNGASTKNAGFACFGSAGELLDDLSNMNHDLVWQTVSMRFEGLNLLRKRLGDKNIDYRPLGGFELFDTEMGFARCYQEIDSLNKKMKEVLGIKNCFTEAKGQEKQFKSIWGVLKNNFEGQIDTSLMMKSLKQLAVSMAIEQLNPITVARINDTGARVEILSDCGTFNARKVVVATNGFASQLLNIKNVQPARAQVLITKPINNLKIKGSFHYQEGYYYFRNIDNRILFGGGRNLDFKGETTSKQGLNPRIQKHLDKLLQEVILPATPYEVEHRWSGIMGVGTEKKPIITRVSSNVIAAVRMGGMGVAIGSLVGKLAARELE